MTSEPEREPFSEAHLNSPEYRERLLRKLNTLIAVLEVATAKVRRSLAEPDPDVERLMRIHKNLRETHEMCVRARGALERREALPRELPENLAQLAPGPQMLQEGQGTPHKLELDSEEERRRFERLGPIQAEQLEAVDLDELMRRLQDGSPPGASG